MPTANNKSAGLPDDKLAYHINEATEVGAGSRSELYEAMRLGKLKAKKRGRRTIILRDDLAAYLLALPDYQPQAKAA